ncbi:adhesion G-protein coupled receptor G2 [Caerostris darwini]|uniref:Adhesion G-protein coupled receptor G2 n=1 Tax=Caerostris darwini TaxID=1538125 RepID=A0AAV4Q1K7_9ARAC|nr:adhesion G-protein coupled receptor G2 [Caerostris darwini]
MLALNYQISFSIHAVIFCLILLISFKDGETTEITESTWMLDNSLGFEVNIPVLTCRTKYKEYSEVKWYKDYALLKKGGVGLSDHILSLIDLLSNDSSVHFDNPLKLQGYYWCETNYINSSVVFRYLFRITEVKTYVGKLLSTQDDLGDEEDVELSIKEKTALKKQIYEDELQEVLFDFLPKPNTYVTDIIERKSGLEVQFYLFVQKAFHPRTPYDRDLVEDQHELEFIFEYLYNETISVDQMHYQQILDWTNFRGINIHEIRLYSTLGCYQDTTLVPGEPPKEITWPFANIGEVVIPIEAWSSKNGLAVTRLCTGSFYGGAHWGNPSSKPNMPPSKLTSELKNLYNKFGDDPKPVYIQNLQQLTDSPAHLSVTDIHIVLDILTELSEVPELTPEEIDETFTVINNIAETNRSELIAAKGTIKFTSRLLKVIDNVLLYAKEKSKQVTLTKKELLVDIKYTKVPTDPKDHIIGMAVLPSKYGNTLENTTVEFLSTSTNYPKHESLAYFLLPPELVIKRENELPSKYPCRINLVLFRDWVLFPKPMEVLHKRNYKVIPTLVMYVSLSGGPAWNLTSPIHLYFKDTHGRKIENPVCSHFDPRVDDHNGGWNTEGCEYGGMKDGFHICRCQHLSIFAVILSEKYDTSSEQFRLGTAVYVGCAVSIIALSFTVVLYLLSKVWRSTVDHSVLFWLALSLLCCLILLFISEMNFLWKPGCLLMAMLLHYTILVVFGWLLVQAVMNRLRFANKSDIEEIPHFILKSALSVWCVPIIIMIIIWITKDYVHHGEETCLKTVSDVSRAAVIPIVIVIFITLCLNVCAIYAVSCRFKKDFLIGNHIYKDSVVKFRVAVTIFFFFVLTWLFGFFAVNEKSNELRILFSISVTLHLITLLCFSSFMKFLSGKCVAKGSEMTNQNLK